MTDLAEAAQARMDGAPVTEAPAGGPAPAPKAPTTQTPADDRGMGEVAHQNRIRRQEFRTRRVEALQQERGEEQNALPTEDERPSQDDDPLARQPEEQTPDAEPSVEENIDGPTAKDDADDGAIPEGEEPTHDDDGMSDPETEESEDAVGDSQLERIEELENANLSMERDYRQKTHRLAEGRRDLENRLTEMDALANFYVGLANKGVEAFETVDWNMLRQNPQEYQRQSGLYQQAVANRDKLVKTLEKVVEKSTEGREFLRQQESMIARDVLDAEIKGWSRERFSQLADFAVEQGLFNEAEMSEMVDWRTIKLLDMAERSASAPKEIGKLKVKGNGKRAPSGPRGTPRKVQQRDANGRFTTARNDLWSNPGNKQAKRSFFMTKLRAEREGRGY